MSVETDITAWRVVTNNKDVGQILTCEPYFDSRRVVTKALNGSVYIQTVGAPTQKMKISVGCYYAGREHLVASIASGFSVTCIYRGKRYVGFVGEDATWNTDSAGEFYTGEFELLVEDVIQT